jgi:phage tail-like protein
MVVSSLGSAGVSLGGAAGGALGGSVGASIGSAVASAGLGALFDALGLGQHEGCPDVPFMFFLEVGGLMCVQFTKAEGLDIKTSVKSVREGGNNRFKHAMIEGQEYTDLTVEKGFFSRDEELFDWMGRIHDATTPIVRQSISLVVADGEGEEIGRFNIYGAFIKEYYGPKFDAASKGKFAFEKMVIRYDFYEYHGGSPLEQLAGAALDVATGALGAAIQGNFESPF